MLPPGYPWVNSKHFSQFGPVIWPAETTMYTYIYMSEDDYYIDFI